MFGVCVCVYMCVFALFASTSNKAMVLLGTNECGEIKSKRRKTKINRLKNSGLAVEYSPLLGSQSEGRRFDPRPMLDGNGVNAMPG